MIRLKIQARRLGVVAVDTQADELVLTAGEQSKMDPDRLVNLLTQAGAGLRVTPGHKIYAVAPVHDPAALLEAARQLFKNLGAA